MMQLVVNVLQDVGTANLILFYVAHLLVVFV